MNEELDSQLSAMFDDELPAAECELLARRLSRDEELKARWGRYAAIGATIRAEGGMRLNADLARRVSVAIFSEPVADAEPALTSAPARSFRWRTPFAGAALAASVAAAAILWVRYQPSGQSPLVAQTVPSDRVPVAQNGGPLATSNPLPSYVVPKTIARRTMVPSTQLANYVVAHSEFSPPVVRRYLLSTFIAGEPGAVEATGGSDETFDDRNDDAKSPQ
jgi:sigma-E factor negative regulatory protein RseA